MTQDEAIRLLAQVVAQTRALPQEHQLLQEALKTLAPKPVEPVKE
jgi:antitoxin component of RelBE/YafQ-DinJ toxin-antitoxin module